MFKYILLRILFLLFSECNDCTCHEGLHFKYTISCKQITVHLEYRGKPVSCLLLHKNLCFFWRGGFVKQVFMFGLLI